MQCTQPVKGSVTVRSYKFTSPSRRWGASEMGQDREGGRGREREEEGEFGREVENFDLVARVKHAPSP